MSKESEIAKIVPSLVWYRPFEPFAYSFIRFCTGAIFVYHGAARLFFGASVAELGLASNLSPSIVGAFELVGGVLVACGFLTRPVALLFAIEWLLIAIAAPVRPGTSWLMLGATPHYPAMVAAICLAFVLRGGGRYSVDRLLGREI